ncbi:MFS transporter [Brevibacterium jeotgali]|nr:MFS transporter [Brevibacterium jeotgali]
MGRWSARDSTFGAVLILLLGAGWAANHFASMLGVLREQEHLSDVLLNGAYGIYALGLLPSLLGGGALADKLGARAVVLTGGAVAAIGNASLLVWHGEAGVLLGRLVVGLGVGLAMSAGTAWAGRLRGAGGAILAGIFLTLGFAVGPIVSGLLAFAMPNTAALPAPFAVTALFSLATVALALVVARGRPAAPAASAVGVKLTPDAGRSVGRALSAALPMAVWVFSCATMTFVVLAGRVADRVESGLLLPGIAALLTLLPGLGAQMLGRRFGWGPRAGITGAVLAAVGMAAAGLGGAVPPVWLFIVASLVLGTAYGLCLQQGLVDVERLSPPESRGTVVGIFYVFTYLGFGLPVLLEALLPTLGAAVPLLALAGLAVLSALLRGLQLVRTGLFRQLR